MKKIVITVSFLLFSNVVSAAPQTVLKCELSKCEQCSLLIDLSAERAEFMDNESSHPLSQVSKTKTKRIFESPPVKTIPSFGYRLVFERKTKRANLTQIGLDQPEKLVSKKMNCTQTDLKLTPEQSEK